SRRTTHRMTRREVAKLIGGTTAGLLLAVRTSFFFQAEDGIRDRTVTGVQTCALPICAARRGGDGPARHPGRRDHPRGAGTRPGRSEERRVGKECRTRWSRTC